MQTFWEKKMQKGVFYAFFWGKLGKKAGKVELFLA
jgi:hypothetical protein